MTKSLVSPSSSHRQELRVVSQTAISSALAYFANSRSAGCRCCCEQAEQEAILHLAHQSYSIKIHRVALHIRLVIHIHWIPTRIPLFRRQQRRSKAPFQNLIVLIPRTPFPPHLPNLRPAAFPRIIPLHILPQQLVIIGVCMSNMCDDDACDSARVGKFRDT